MKNQKTMKNLILFFLLTFSATTFAQGLVYDNGSFVTGIGTGAGGADESVLQNTSLGMNTLGSGAQCNFPASLADDFTVPAGEAWAINQMTFYGYQTGSSTTSTFTGISIRIWDGNPALVGSNIIFGDLSSNVMSSTAWTGVYRVLESGLGATNRPIMEVKANISTVLLDGTYWVEYCLTGSSSFSGPWVPPVTVLGNNTTGDMLQNNSGTWANPVLDFGTNTPQGLSFQIAYSQAVPTVSEWGLIILALLLLSFSMVAVRRRKLAFAGAENSMNTGTGLPFDLGSFKKALHLTIGLVLVLGCSSLVLWGEISTVDIIGTAIAAPIFAYLMHFVIQDRLTSY